MTLKKAQALDNVDGSGSSMTKNIISNGQDEDKTKTAFIPDMEVLEEVFHFSTKSKRVEKNTDPLTGKEISTYTYKTHDKYKTVTIEATTLDGSPVVWTSRHCQLLCVLLRYGHDRGGVDGPKRKYYGQYDPNTGEPKLDKNGKQIRKPGPKRKAFQSDIVVLSVSETLDQMGMSDKKDNRKALTKLMKDICNTEFTITRDNAETFRFLDRFEHRRGYWIAFWGSDFLELVKRDGYRPKPYPEQLFQLSPGKTKYSGGNFYTGYQIAHKRVMVKKPASGPIVEKFKVKTLLEFNPMMMSIDEYKLAPDKHKKNNRPKRDMWEKLEGYLMELNFMDFFYIDPEGRRLSYDEAHETMTFEKWSNSSIEITFFY